MKPLARTVGDGAYRLEAWIMGALEAGRLLGRNVKTQEAVQISLILGSRESPDALSARFQYDIRGIACCTFIGDTDEPETPFKGVVLVEEMPAGLSLLEARASLEPADQFAIVKQLADLVVRAKRSNVILAGLRPELVYWDRATRVVGVMPRAPVFFSTRSSWSEDKNWQESPFADLGYFIDPDTINPLLATPATDVYLWGLVVSWLFTGEYPFAGAPARNDSYIDAMDNDERDPFTGPAAIGRILDEVLLADPARRLSAEDLVAALRDVSDSHVSR